MFHVVHIIAFVVEVVESRRRRQEEDKRYTMKELEEGWEFKIVRAYIGTFQNTVTLQELVQEEARAGWEMLELFNDSRVRFKRRRSEKANDALLPSDVNPYRTTFRMAAPDRCALWFVCLRDDIRDVRWVISLPALGSILAIASLPDFRHALNVDRW